MHRDINLSNILYSKSKRILKLIDFGVAKNYCEDGILNFSSVGNPEFKAPEMILEKPYNEKVDCWGLGLVLYSLVLGKKIKSKTIMKAAKMKQRLQFPNNISFEL